MDAGEAGPLDLHAVLKACYFADKSHLNEYGRPVFGAVYRAMKYGPVPLEIYEMLKGEPLWLWETKQEDFPWRVRSQGRIEPVVTMPRPNLGVFSESDLEHLRAGFDRARSITSMSGPERRTGATGKEPISAPWIMPI